MYAVGKVLYSVAGPFHPFGGAVDIVVVQQQDGSFKSSPWYVRFGKFQGVLKTREKVVNIAVNGVEAGFHMYLDSNGEAHFLRDADSITAEGDFVVSTSSLGDEREVLMQDAQLRKSKSTSCDISTMEASAGDGKMPARTVSRQSTILERMFGRKPNKDNAPAVDSVCSLERAEIAAELLDAKWSTNLSHGSEAPSSDHEPSSSHLRDAGNGNQGETAKMVLPDCSLDHDKAMGSNCDNVNSTVGSPHGGSRSSGDEKAHCIQTTSVEEEIVAIYAHKTDGIMSTIDWPGPEYMSNDLDTGKSINESVDTQGELQRNLEDVTVREMHTEVFSNGIFEIHAIETGITDCKSEVVSQLVAVDSDKFNQNFTEANSPTFSTITYLSSETHDGSSIACGHKACQEKVVIISTSETLESSYDVSNILADEVHYAEGNSLADGLQFEECSRVSSGKLEQEDVKERSLSNHSSSNKEDLYNLGVPEVSVFDDSSSQTFQANLPDKDISVSTLVNDHMDISVNTVANDHNTSSSHDLACQHGLIFPDASPGGIDILSYVHENDSDDVAKDSTVNTKTCYGEHDVSFNQPPKIQSVAGECIAQTHDVPNKVEGEVSSIIFDFSSLSKVDTENIKLEYDENRSGSASGVDIELVPESAFAPTDKAETIVPSCEFVDEIQFQFSGTTSFADRKTLDDIIANKTACEGVHDEADGDADEEGGNDTDLGNESKKHSDLSRPKIILIPNPGSELHLCDSNLEAKSAPNLCSHINDLESSDGFQVSRSLYNGENSGVDQVESKNSGFSEQELEGTSESKENSGLCELINSPVPDNKHSDDLKDDSFNPFVELSLCRHLLSEGMGADAACKTFDAEKITLEKFRAMEQSLIRNGKLVVRISGRYFPWDVAAPVVRGMVSFREEQLFEHQGMIKVERVEPSTTQGGSWRIWPFSFKRTRTINSIQPVCESTVASTLSIPVRESDGERNKASAKMMERKVRSLTPTSEELASLHLREGRNIVTFTFSTAMLGTQQVDAHIYLWEWNAHIVISDVDGTITKSDVLGQFMPMVGVDWSQNGVAHLFSAIKENGYHLLFLSARSISQAHLTRQFLFNLKQDGKALPDGPVVISPDGLFPSLYREVIRRAPHEFKISCLADIKALFPPDSHPFYAGFGNRDTDELSYLKVGIPMGKIFIINPKGEVAVNRRVNTKSYMSLHALVNRVFPPLSSPPEQEDYNTWNYWKMPVADI
nr:phosphatidate phosphatase PAH1 [Aegilops tauschii subsp. strangulata]